MSKFLTFQGATIRPDRVVAVLRKKVGSVGYPKEKIIIALDKS